MNYRVKVIGVDEDGHTVDGVFTIEAADANEAVVNGIEAGWDCGWHEVEAHVMVKLGV